MAGPGHKLFCPLPYVDIVDYSTKQREYVEPDLAKMKYVIYHTLLSLFK